MKSFRAPLARRAFYRLLDEVSVSGEPVQITGLRACVVLVSRDEWDDLQETIHLLSIPGMRASIREGLRTQLDECREDLDW